MRDKAWIEKMGLDESEYHELLNLFMETTASNLERLLKGLGSGDALTVMEAAHTIKGSSANLGLENIAAVAKEVEEKARRKSLEGVSEAVQCIREHCGRIAETLKVA